MPDYSHRDVLDKLGIKPGHVVAFVEAGGPLDPTLCERALERIGRPPAQPGEPIDIVLASADNTTNCTLLLQEWRPRIKPNGAIWLLTPKRTLPGYIDQRDLIPQGLAASMVDNKNCSISPTTGALRFVIRLSDRKT